MQTIDGKYRAGYYYRGPSMSGGYRTQPMYIDQEFDDWDAAFAAAKAAGGDVACVTVQVCARGEWHGASHG